MSVVFQKVPIPIGDTTVKPGSKRKIRGYGMPISKQPGQYGDLIVTIEVAFPPRLSPQQKQAVRQILS